MHALRPAHLALFTLLFIVSVVPVTVYANDSVFIRLSSDVAPVEETRLIMASEEIVITERSLKKERKPWDETYWSIAATYTFANPTDEPVEVTLGFPEGQCNDSCGDECDDDERCSQENLHYTFRDMTTQVDGKRVTMRLAEIAPQSEWSSEFGTVHLFDVTVPAKGSVEVTHRYEMDQSRGSQGEDYFYYVTRTGALWNGPIGKASFTLELLNRPWGFSFPPGYELTEYATNKAGDKTVVRFEMTDWTPRHDLLFMRGAMNLVTLGCPTEEFLLGSFINLWRLEELSEEQLRTCRNLFYAYHGYTFKDQTLYDLFYGHAEPTPVSEMRDAWGASSSVDPEHSGVLFRPHEGYSPDHLSADETHWIKAIKKIEKRRETVSTDKKKK